MKNKAIEYVTGYVDELWEYSVNSKHLLISTCNVLFHKYGMHVHNFSDSSIRNF